MTRRIGELSAELEKGKGVGKGQVLPTGGKYKAEALKAAGLSTSVAHRARFQDEDYNAPMPWGMRAALVLGAIVWLFAIVGVRSLFGQVAPVITIVHGDAVTQVGNQSRQPQTVTLTLWRSLTDSTAPAVLVSPSRVVLDPGALQTVRLRTRETCSPAWRWVVVFTPVKMANALANLVPVSLTLVTRIVAKVACT